MEYNNKKLLKKFVVATFLAATLSGCVTPNVNQAQKSNIGVSTIIESSLSKNKEISNKNHFIEEKNGYYFHGKSFKLNDKDRLPRIFKEKIVISKPELISLSDLSNLISEEYDVNTKLTDDAISYIYFITDQLHDIKPKNKDASEGSTQNFSDSTFPSSNSMNSSEPPLPELVLMDEMEMPGGDDSMSSVSSAASFFTFNIAHNGSLTSLLDKVSSKAGLFWKWEDNQIVLFRTETKTMILNDLPGAIKFTASTGSYAKSSGGGDSSSTSANSSHGIELTSSAKSNWDAMEFSISSMMTELGKVSYSEQTGTITVTDTPIVMSKVSKYVDEMNEIISQRILLKVDILDINYTDEDSAGIDINALFDGSSKFGFEYASNLIGGTSIFDVGMIDPDTNWTGSTAMIQALKKNYELSVVSSTMSYTTNGVPVPVQILEAETYIANVVVEEDEDGNSTSTLTPAVLNKGINMSMLPKRMSNGDILLHMSADLLSLNSMVEVTSGTTTIQLPNTEQKNFMQRVAITPGETIMLAGFERTYNDSRVDSIFGKSLWGVGGKKSGGTKKTKTIILVTPYTMSN
jgi:type IVB pilus formation R64 PilN family outer membrane protein